MVSAQEMSGWAEEKRSDSVAGPAVRKRGWGSNSLIVCYSFTITLRRSIEDSGVPRQVISGF